MGRSFRQIRREVLDSNRENRSNDNRRNNRLERIAKKQMRADKKNFSDDDRIRSHNNRGFLDRLRNRNDPDVIRERIAKKKLKLAEQQLDTKQKLDKAKRPKSSFLQPQQPTRASRGGRSGRRQGRQSAAPQSNSILDSSPGEGLNDLFGFSSQSTTKKKGSGIDGLSSLFG
ncbi:hypothetical protein HOV56_gp29 [Nitrosopumilus spindle-shaped virus]|uniref:Uncharacterized protein n=1 Tax=Nitrosopumilus spindle-shaped virus TaxID=2508184 RepID=A0A514K2V9_9VIRU|nr:hypothetical protein HOV56_gp29 [Nitrosopumilus spindle-shaped virus]YP_010772858.1 hypothetical protein QIT54_gp28 [Nitrosopumilus spindle-shaped virus]QDI73918.1 hypothetical protein [Nitrosopumilus spindle-shaped virus]QDI73966.1 hypothetical protein [Nitrosopumilus spindle-shaped virus]